MAANEKQPRIVAELGRPETPQETAARKAENSRLYRERKTVNNLIFSLLVSLALMVVLVLIVPRGVDQWSDHTVNVAETAEQTAPTAGQPLIAPPVPDDWKAKQAQLRADPTSNIAAWYIGYTTKNGNLEAYAAVVQAFTTDGKPVNETWIAQQLENQSATGTEHIGGLEWVVYDHPRRDPRETNMVYGLQTEVGTTTLLVFGTDKPEALRELAAQVAAEAKRLDLAGASQPGSAASSDGTTAPTQEAS